uniref:Snakin-2 n=1 Tax=Araucaria cunninghamii TaxID=56994 RepID=A0A0D6R8F9_ARACU
MASLGVITVRKLLLACLVMGLVFQMYTETAQVAAAEYQSVGLQTSGVYRRLLESIDCNSACGQRCKAASRTKICLRACGTCCARCNCVPPGTYGNRDVCPCYATMKTHGGRLKCP